MTSFISGDVTTYSEDRRAGGPVLLHLWMVVLTVREHRTVVVDV